MATPTLLDRMRQDMQLRGLAGSDMPDQVLANCSNKDTRQPRNWSPGFQLSLSRSNQDF